MMDDNFDEIIVDESINFEEENPYLRQFIEVYKSLPELWDSNSEFYKDKSKREAAVKKLLPVYGKLKPNPTEKDVRKKINSLRTNYRKSLKKIIEAENGMAEECIPTSWVFHALHFLGDKMEFNNSIKCENVDWTSLSPDEQPEPQPSKNKRVSSTRGVELKRVSSGNGNQFIVSAAETQFNRVINKSENQFNRIANKSLDRCEAFGVSVGGDLRLLENRQQAIAQKLISDVIFAAKFGRLSESTSLVIYPDIDEVSPTSPTQSTSDFDGTNGIPPEDCFATGQL